MPLPPSSCPTCGAPRHDLTAGRFDALQLPLFGAADLAGIGPIAAPSARPAVRVDGPTATPTPKTSSARGQAVGTRAEPGALVRQTPAAPKPKTKKVDPLTPRERLALRLEVAVWFVGVTLAVGGALLATRLFWEQLPELFRPGIIGLALSSIGGAFIAGGSVLTARYPRAHAGSVLSMVGRLFAFSAALPVAPLFNGHAVVGALSLSALAGVVGVGHAIAVRLGKATRSSAAMTLGAMALIAIGPVAGWSTLLVTLAGAALARAGLAAGHRRALSGEPVFVSDLAAVAAGAFAVGNAWVTTATSDATALAILLVGVGLLIDAATRTLEARRIDSESRDVLRRLGASAVLLLGAVAAGAVAVANGWWLPAVLACVLAYTQLRTPTRLQLPEATRVLGWGALAATGAFVAPLVLPVVALVWPWATSAWLGGALAVTVFSALAWCAVGRGDRTGDAALALASLLLIVAVPAGAFVTGSGLLCLPVAALFLAHRATAARDWQAVTGVLLLAAAGALLLGDLDNTGSALLTLRALLALLLPSAGVIWALVRQRCVSRTAAFLLATAGLAIPLMALAAENGSAAVALVGVGTLMLVAQERFRRYWIGLWAVVCLTAGAVALTSLDALNVIAPLLAAAAWLPRLRTTSLRLPAWLPLGGRSPRARRLAFELGSAAVALVVAVRVLDGAWSAPLHVHAMPALALLLTAGLIIARTRTAQVLAGGVAAVAVVGWWAGAALPLAAPIGTATGGLLAMTAMLTAVVVARRFGVDPGVLVRGRARHRRRATLELPVIVGLLVGAVMLAVGVGGHVVGMLRGAEASPLGWLVAAGAGLALVAWSAHGFGIALVGGQVLLSASLVVTLLARFKDEPVALTCAVALSVVPVAWALLARAAYRGGLLQRGRLWLERIPSPALVRAVPYTQLGVQATLAALVFLWARTVGGGDMLLRWVQEAPVVVAIVSALGLLPLLRWHRRLRVFGGVGLGLGAWVFVLRSWVRLAGLSESTGGLGTAAWSLTLVGVALTLNAPVVRRWAGALRASLARRDRHRLSAGIVVSAQVLAGMATVRSFSLGVPSLWVLVLVAASMGAAAMAWGRRGSVRVSTGIVLAAVFFVLVGREAPNAIHLATWTVVAAAGLALDLLAPRLARVPWQCRWRLASGLAANRHAARLRSAGRLTTLASALVSLLVVLDAPRASGSPWLLVMTTLLTVVAALRTWRGPTQARPALLGGALALTAVALTGWVGLGFDAASTPFAAAALVGGLVALVASVVLQPVRRHLQAWRMVWPPAAASQSVGGLSVLVLIAVVSAAVGGTVGPSPVLPLVALAPLAVVVLAPQRWLAVPAVLGTAFATMVSALIALPDVERLVAPSDDGWAVVTAALAIAALVGPSTAAPLQRLMAALDTRVGLRPRRANDALTPITSLIEQVWHWLALVALGGALALGLMIPMPSALGLAATWVALAAAAVALSRVGAARQRPLWAALGQGAAMAIYVDLRRRTGWLDDLEGIDAFVALAAAGLLSTLRLWRRPSPQWRAFARAGELYAATLPIVATFAGPSHGARALILVVAGGLWGAMARVRRRLRYELLAGAALVSATWFALSAGDASAVELYALPVACVGTWFGHRHRARLGPMGRWLSVGSQIPTYVTTGWAALSHGSFGAFALALILGLAGGALAFIMRDRRSLYAAGAEILVLVVGRLTLAGFDNALLGTLLLIGTGFGVLGAMTALSVARERALRILQRLRSELRAWDGA